MRSSPLTLFPLFLFLWTVGCADAVKSGVGIQVAITNVFAHGVVQAGDPAITLSAVVNNDSSHQGVEWSLTVANTGCAPGCGTLAPSGSPSFSAVYTPPTVAPSNQNATISVRSVKDKRQIYSFNFTIVPTTSVTIGNKFSTTIAGGPGIVVNAAVADDFANAGVTWTLTAGGISCAPACGTLTASDAPSFAALYAPPATVPTGANASPTITATSVTRTSANDSFNFSITSPAALLKGSFSFLLRGYDSGSGAPMAMAGTIVADGNGNITGGEIDFNNGGGINSVPSPATGVYTVDNAFNGITKGSFEITSFKFPGTNIDLRFRVVLSADGKHGRIIELDGSGYLNSGTIQMQDPTAASVKPTGSFAFGLDSDAPLAGRIVSVGQLVIGSSGITGGLIDQSKAADPSPIYSGATIRPDSASAPDANGRGTLTITVGDNSTQYAYYIVDSTRFLLVQIGEGLKYGTVQAGTARAQKSLTASSIQTTSVLQLTGMDEPTGTSTVGPAVIIGVMAVGTENSFNLTFDSNDLGTILVSHPASGSISSFDPVTGRAVLSSPGGFGSGFVDSAVIYLYDTGSGFFIDSDISTPDGTPPDQAMTNNAYSGTLTNRTGAPFNASSLTGNFIAGFGGSASPDIPNFELGVTLNSTAGTYAAAGDLASLPSQDGLATNVQFNGTFGLVNSSLGHGSLTLPAAVFGDFTSGATSTASFYLIGPNQFVLIGIDQGRYSGVAFFDPQ